MRNLVHRAAHTAAIVTVLGLGSLAHAEAVITSFDNFNSDSLFPSWDTATINSGPTSYDITSSGYGSNYKYIGDPVITGEGNSIIELTVTLDGDPEADGQLGPIVDLIDGDGTRYSYRWYGQTLGSHVLTMPIESPTEVVDGSPGLDLNTLTHMHMQLDPSGYGGTYTVAWENLSLIVPEPGTALLLTTGGCLLLGIRRRK